MQEHHNFVIEGMTCQACATRIEKVLSKKPAILKAQVNFASEEAQLLVDSQKISADEIIALIAKTGFTAKLKAPDTQLEIEVKHMSMRLWLLLLINIPFLIGMVGMMFGSHQWMIPPMWQFVLASIVQFFLAIPFYKSAYASLKGGLANMDVLVTIGTVAIYGYSVYMLFFDPHRAHHGMPHVYFEASVMVIGFVSLGKFLEDRAKKTSLNSLSMLIKLRPQQVHVRRDNRWQSIALDQLIVGDSIRANTGERIAADGIVVEGSAWSDESHLTGESKLEEKTVGSRVLAGSMVSDGSIVYTAEQLGSHTLLGDMMNALSEAQGSKAPIARIADKVASVFVPVVVAIAVLTFIAIGMYSGDWSQALMNAVAVLVIACPCALGLATPAAIMVGMGQAVKRGVWFKDATVMEEAAHVNTVVLDKTGTLTEGKPSVKTVYTLNEQYSIDDILRLMASVEQASSHPLARAIVQAAEQKSLNLEPISQVETVAGEGIVATIEGIGVLKVGKPSFCAIDANHPEVKAWTEGLTVVAMAINNQGVGLLTLQDALKQDTLVAIQRLQSHHIEVYIMSGDNQSVVDSVAAQLNIPQTHALGHMRPRDKAERVQQFKDSARVVAMVGDGINDAPALAAANVSFAMKEGADVAENTASATLMSSSVTQLVDALLVSRATLRNIKQNLFFAFIYNIIGIPLAALGFLNPVIAGAAMALSSISVLSNALRLKYLKI